ncbi:MAG: hypothetical protein ACR2OR_09535 [Hyphomicrobiales bacterium]
MTKSEKDAFIHNFMDANYMAIDDKNSEDPNKRKTDFEVGVINKLNTKTTQLCNTLNDLNIRVYTITFQVSTNTVRNLMRNCASDPSLYFDSPSGTELRSAFKAIGVDLNNLRIRK